MTKRPRRYPIDGQEPAFGDQLPAIAEPVNTAQVRDEWAEDAAPKIREYYRRGGRGQIRDAGAAMDIPEPPNTKSDWGRLASEMHRDGDLEPVGMAKAKRRKTRKSLVYVWQAGPALLAKAGVAP